MGLEDHVCAFEAITSAPLRAATSPIAKRQSASRRALEKTLICFFFSFHASDMDLSGRKPAAFLNRNSPFNYKSHLVHSSLL